MEYLVSPGTATSRTVPLTFTLSRIQAGDGDTDIEIQFHIDVNGVRESHALLGASELPSPILTGIFIRTPRELAYLLDLKRRLSIGSPDRDFMSDVAKGILGMFAVNAALSYDTMYVVGISRELAAQMEWADLPNAPRPFDNYADLGQLLVRATVPDDTDREQ